MKFKFFHSLFALASIFAFMCVSGCGGDSPEEPDRPNTEIQNPGNPDNPDDPDNPGGGDDPSKDPLPVPGLSFTTITLPNEGDTFACVIHGLTDNSWNAKSNQSWCSVSIYDNTLKISVSPNTGGGQRMSIISLLHFDGREIGNILLYQSSFSDAPIEYNSLSKHSFYPMFTATWCPFSPDMDRTLDEIQKRWSYPIVPMRIHVADSELYTPLSVELSKLYDNSTTPTGYFENYFVVNNRHDGNVSVDYFWNLILSHTSGSVEYTKSCSSIGCKSTMTDNEINAEVTIKPFASGEYRLSCFILEDNIISPQMSKSDGEIENYCHNAVLVGALTPIKGQEMELTSSQKVLSLAGKTPVNSNLSNLRLLIVLERNVANLNYSDNCWYADNCLSVPLGKSSGNGMVENIYIGNDIEN